MASMARLQGVGEPVGPEYGFVPPATHRMQVATAGSPREFYVLLLPNTTMLALSGAIEPLRVANQVAGEVLYRWFTVTESGDPVRCSNGIEIRPDLALHAVPRNALLLVCSGVRVQESIGRPTVNWLRRHVKHGGGVGSLCAGVFALAEAGLLAGRTFTLHWENQPVFREKYPELDPTPRRYEITDGFLSCGGGSAAIDMMLEFIERDHGQELALYVADMCMHSRAGAPDAPQKTATAAAFGCRSKALTTSIDYMSDHLEDMIRSEDLARKVGISTRQLERLFRRHTGRSPMQMLTELRLSRAYALLNETDMSIGEIAVAAGFGSLQLFSRKFRERYSQSPHGYRRSWIARAPIAQRDTAACL